MALESGEYFLSDWQKQARAAAAKDEKQAARVAEKVKERAEAFVAPKVRMESRQKPLVGTLEVVGLHSLHINLYWWT